MVEEEKVRGHNDARYDTVPKEDQIFKVEFVEIAPTPIIADRVFFVHLRGYIPESKKRELALPDEGLFNATLKISSSVVYPDGSREKEDSVIIPLKTTPFNSLAHLILRDSGGIQVEYLTPSGDHSDILLDFQIPTIFLRSGIWTFRVDARLGDTDNTCLVAMSLTQWLEGWLR